MLNIPTWLLSDEQLKDVIETWRDVHKNADEAPNQNELDALKALEDYARDFRGVVVE